MRNLLSLLLLSLAYGCGRVKQSQTLTTGSLLEGQAMRRHRLFPSFEISFLVLCRCCSAQVTYPHAALTPAPHNSTHEADVYLDHNQEFQRSASGRKRVLTAIFGDEA